MLRVNGSILKQDGFSISEMMVAILVASIILTGFVNLFIHSLRTNNNNIRLEQNIYTSRVATRIINKEIRNAKMACQYTFPGNKKSLIYHPVWDTSIVNVCKPLPQYGYFQYDPVKKNLCWKRPYGSKCDTIVRKSLQFSVIRIGSKVWRIRVYGEGRRVKVYTTVSTRN